MNEVDARSDYRAESSKLRYIATALGTMSAIALAGCGHDSQRVGNDSKEVVQSQGVLAETALPECPEVTPKFLSDGGLQARAIAPDADTFGTHHYFAVFAATGEGVYATERTAWYAPFDGGVVVITITPQVMELVHGNEGGIVTVSVRSDITPPEASLLPEGDVGSADMEDLTIKAAQEKGINRSNMKDRSNELPVSQICSNADWDANQNVWIAQTMHGEVVVQDPFTPFLS